MLPLSWKYVAPSVKDALTAAVTVVAIAVVFVLHDPEFFWNDDYQLAFLPAFEEMNRAWRGGEWPLLSESSWICGNLAGEYQYGTFSLFIATCILTIWTVGLSLPAKAAAFSIIHLAVLGGGAMILSRSRGIRTPHAMLVVVIACFNGWNMCWAATNWIAALSAFAWLPWAWWGMDRVVALPHARWPVFMTAIFLYLVLTAGWPFTVLMLLVLTTWRVIQSVDAGISGPPLARIVARVSISWVAAALLALPALWSLVVHVLGSQRVVEWQSLQWTWVMPPAALPGMILPTITAVWQTFSEPQSHVGLELAGGLVPLAILTASLAENRGRIGRGVAWLVGLTVVALTASMLPSMGVFRWSFRWLPLAHLALALASAEVATIHSPRLTAMVAVGLTACGVGWCFTGAGSIPAFDWHAIELCGIVIVWFFIALLLQRASWRHAAHLAEWLPVMVSACSLLTLFLRVPAYLAVPVAPLGENLLSAAPLDSQRLYVSAYFGDDIPTRRIGDGRTFGAALRPGNTSMLGDARTINGYSPIQAAGIATMLPFETHGQMFPLAWKWILGNALGPVDVFEVLGVDGIFVSRTAARLGVPPREYWEQVWEGGEGRLFHRRAGLPNAVSLFRASADAGGVPVKRNLSVRQRHRLEVVLSPEDDARLAVFSQPWHPGWEARLNSRPIPVEAYKKVALAVPIEPGASGRLELAYRPRAVMLGVPIASLTFIALLVWLLGYPAFGR